MIDLAGWKPVSLPEDDEEGDEYEEGEDDDE
jgi:hypothetical protein